MVSPEFANQQRLRLLDAPFVAGPALRPRRLNAAGGEGAPATLARVDVFAGSQTGETNRAESLAVLVSDTGEEGSFRQVGQIENCPTAETGAQGEFQILTGETARYVRVVATKKVQGMTIGELRIWGYPGDGLGGEQDANR